MFPNEEADLLAIQGDLERSRKGDLIGRHKKRYPSVLSFASLSFFLCRFLSRIEERKKEERLKSEKKKEDVMTLLIVHLDDGGRQPVVSKSLAVCFDSFFLRFSLSFISLSFLSFSTVFLLG